jgi:hypothetical protein
MDARVGIGEHEQLAAARTSCRLLELSSSALLGAIATTGKDAPTSCTPGRAIDGARRSAMHSIRDESPSGDHIDSAVTLLAARLVDVGADEAGLSGPRQCASRVAIAVGESGPRASR